MTSEFQLFNSLPMGDTWPDAKLADCFFYLWTCKRVAIPQEWRETMKLFAKELKAVPLHLFGGRGFKGLPSIRVVPILSYCVALLPILPSRPEVHDPDPFGLESWYFASWLGVILYWQSQEALFSANGAKVLTLSWLGQLNAHVISGDKKTKKTTNFTRKKPANIRKKPANTRKNPQIQKRRILDF